MADSAGMTLMDLISSDPTPTAPPPPSSSSSAPPAAMPPPSSGMVKHATTDRKSKRGTLLQIQSDTISAAKAALNPVRTNILPQKHKQRKKPVSYAQLARSIHELAATSDQKTSQKQLVHHVFPKLAVYNSVDPSLAPSLLMLDQQCEDRTVLRYVYYYLARILGDPGSQGLTSGGGIPTPNWDALADIDAVGGVTRADVAPRIVDRLTSEALNADVEFHARRLQALKALTYAPSTNSEILSKSYEIVFNILDKVADGPQKSKKGIFGTKGGDKEFIIRSNLQYAALSALRRLPLDPGNPAFLHRAVQGVSFADPVAVRHALEMISELAIRDPYAVAMALGKLVQPGGALHDVLHLHDVLARVALARLCYSISRARALDERPDIKSQFNSLLYQLLLDPSERVCFEAIFCILGKFDNAERTEERAGGWYRLTREILKVPDAPSAKGTNAEIKDAVPPKPTKDKAQKTRRPQLLIKLVMRRLLQTWLLLFSKLQEYLLLKFQGRLTLMYCNYYGNAQLIDIYRNRHNISASAGMSDPAVATGISELIYETTKELPAEPDSLDDDLVNAWAANLGDDGLWGNNAPAMNRVNEFLAGAGTGTDAPDVEENIIYRPSMSYDDMWAKTLLETSELEEDDARSSGTSSPDSIGSVETSISSHFGGMNYPSLFSSKPAYGSSQSTFREDPPSYTSPVRRFESFENPLAGTGSSSFESSQDEERASSGNPQFGSALYDFTAGSDDELNLVAGEEVEIEYEVDGWFYVKKKRPGRDGKLAGLVPVLYVSQS